MQATVKVFRSDFNRKANFENCALLEQSPSIIKGQDRVICTLRVLFIDIIWNLTASKEGGDFSKV